MTENKPLTANQERVRGLLGENKTVKQIAKALGTSETVIKRHITVLRNGGHLGESGPAEKQEKKEAKGPTFDEMIPAGSNGHSSNAFDLDKKVGLLVESGADSLRRTHEQLVATIAAHDNRRKEIAEEVSSLQEEDARHADSIHNLKIKVDSVVASLASLTGST